MIEPLTLSHVALPAKNPESLKHWYCQNLGFIARENQLWSNGTVLTISKGTPVPNDDWHLGFRLSSKQALLYWLERLRAIGIEPAGPAGDDHIQSFYIRDPEGNNIEFFVENPPE